MSENWSYRIPHVTPGEPVEAGVVSRPDRALADRTDYLKDRLDAAEAGKAIFDLGATLSSDVLPGHAVYWNAQEQRYEPALVVVEADPVSHVLMSTPSSDCVGICYQKTAETKGDIVLRGLVTFKNLTNSIGETVTPGKYFLSAVVPGKLSQQKPPITVTVCYVLGPRDNCSDDLRVIVCPQVRDSLDEHTHYRFDLVAKPAGTLTITTTDDVDRLSITANANLEGWLPANHATFNGKAPPGAKFGYNLAKHTALQRVWPPIPIQSVAILWDKASPDFPRLGATEIPLGAQGVAIVDVNGIWWMSDCRDDVPFVEDATALDITTDQCPRDEKMRVVLVFLRLLIGNNRRVVTSLDRDVASPIKITNCDNVVAQTGDLKLDLDLQEVDCAPLTEEDHELGPEQGGKVYTDIVAASATNTNKNKLKKSWVTEGVFTTTSSDAVTITGTWNRTLTPAEKIYFGFVNEGTQIPVSDVITVHQGLLRFDVASELTTTEIEPQIIRLDDAVERIYMDVPYLGFPQGQDSAVRLRFNVPYVNLPSGGALKIKMRVQLFTRAGTTSANGPIPPLQMTYRVMQKIEPTDAGFDLIDSDVTTGTGGAALFPINLQAPRDYVIERESLAFSVTAGSTVLVTFKRLGSDTTLGEAGIVRISGILFNE